MVNAQKDLGYKLLLSSSSPRGNYLYLFDGSDLQDSTVLANTDYFVIKKFALPDSLDKKSFDLLESSVKQIGIAKKPTTLAELKAVLPANNIKAMKEVYKLKTDQDVIGFMQNHSDPRIYFLFYQYMEMRMALSHIFLDKDVKEGIGYLYYVYRVDKQKKQKLWGKTIVMGKIGNYRLPAYEAMATSLNIMDSSVEVQWGVPINIKTDNLPIPTKRLGFDKDGQLYNTFFVPANLRATIEVGIDDKWEKQEGLLFPRGNKNGDTLFFSFKKKVLPGAIVRTVLTLQDEVQNIGNHTDTLNAFIVTKKNAPTIKDLTIRDTLNAIYLSWNKLPDNPFLSGIQIIRYGEANKADTLTLLPVTDTNYTDYATKAGVQYRYDVRVLYLPGMPVYQTTPSSSFTTLTKFSRPTPPHNLVASNEGRHIRLNWETTKDPTIDVYYVYRGLKPDNLQLLPGNVSQTTYLDTTVELSGGSQYYYAVSCQNLMQKMSVYSNTVSIIPDRKLFILPPRELSFYYENGRLNVLWTDARQFDNHIQSFLVQKRTKDKGLFFYLTEKPTEAITLIDTAIVRGIAYQYRAASISFKGDTSQFSEPFEYELAKNRVAVLKEFNLANTKKGIKVLIPTAYYNDRKAYNIYRRKESDANFTFITSIKANQFVYEDTQVKDGQIYFYAISITETDEREGQMSMPAEMRRSY